jgi:predicted methyltransferase
MEDKCTFSTLSFMKDNFVQLVRATFGHNCFMHFCTRVLYSKKKDPLSKGHYKLERSKSADWWQHLKSCVHYVFLA